MRVIGGTARGRRLSAPKGTRVRPTADRVKEALFNIITSLLGELDGLRVLDIFAGTGSLGIEALSRGCSEAVFIDSHRESAEVIRRNLQQLGFMERSRVIVREASSAIDLLAVDSPFNLVFLDPPYQMGLAEKILQKLADAPFVTDGTIIVAESGSDEDIPHRLDDLICFDRRVYGDTALTFFQKGTTEENA